MTRRFHAPRRPSTCPSCQGRRVATILYGLPDHSPELEADLEAGRVVLGGCCISRDDPVWCCLDCRASIFRERTEA